MYAGIVSGVRKSGVGMGEVGGEEYCWSDEIACEFFGECCGDLQM